MNGVVSRDRGPSPESCVQAIFYFLPRRAGGPGMTMAREEKMVLKTPVSREEAERVLTKGGIGCGAVMALRFAHTLLATMTELEQVRGERDYAVEVADRDHARATAAEAANAAMTDASEGER